VTPAREGASPLVKGTLLEGHRLSYGLFHSFLSLIDSGAALKPLAVVRRDTDDRVFVYE
jgi:hypothetical protein